MGLSVGLLVQETKHQAILAIIFAIIPMRRGVSSLSHTSTHIHTLSSLMSASINLVHSLHSRPTTTAESTDI